MHFPKPKTCLVIILCIGITPRFRVYRGDLSKTDFEIAKNLKVPTDLSLKKSNGVSQKRQRRRLRHHRWGNHLGEGEYVFDNLKDSTNYLFRVRCKNKSGWGAFSMPISVNTRGIYIESKLLKSKHKEYLFRWLTGPYRDKRWKLMFRASKHGFQAASFHKKCDGKKGETFPFCLKKSGKNMQKMKKKERRR